MRKKFLSGKRVLALALALSMVVSEAAFASPADAVDTADEVVTTDTVSANDAEEAVVETPSEEIAEVTQEFAEEVAETEEVVETVDEEDVEAEEAANGTLSQVIGVKVEPQGRVFTDGLGNIVARYTSANPSQSYFYVPGEIKEDPATGLYAYGGKTYSNMSYDKAANLTRIDPDNEVMVVPGTSNSDYRDKATGLYVVNGVTYSWVGSTSKNVLYVNPRSQAVVVATMPEETFSYTAIHKQFGVYTNTVQYNLTNPEDLYDNSPSYYVVNGKTYSSVGSTWARSDTGQYMQTAYVTVADEILLNMQNPYVSWVELTNPNTNRDELETNYMVRYELMVDGQPYNNFDSHGVDAKGEMHYFTSDTGLSLSGKPMAAGASVKVQVRGILVHYVNKTAANEDGTVYGENYYEVDSVGEWSDEVSYKMTFETAVAKVTSVSATKVAGLSYDVFLKWNAVPTANQYVVYVIDAKKPLAIDASNFKKYYNEDDALMTAAGLEYSDIDQNSYPSAQPEYQVNYSKSRSETYNYHYYAIGVNGVADASVNINAFNNTIDSVAAVASYQSAPASLVKAPALTGVKVEKQADGTFDLVWNKVDANVVIYAYEEKAFPANYQYYAFADSVRREVKTPTGYTRTISLSSDLYANLDEDGDYGVYDAVVDHYVENTSKDYVKYEKVLKRTGISGKNGKYTDLIRSFGLTAGKTYYFVAYTYDTSDNDVEKAPIPYTYAARYYKDGVITPTTVSAVYTKYPTLSAPSAVVSVKAKLEKPSVRTFSAAKSIKFMMNATGAAGTGFEIYRKEGKKFKKVATTSASVYTDEGLKAGATYNYKIRSYGYQPGDKKVYYSEYALVTAKTFAASDLSLNVTKASKTNVKLKWTKVAGATKYDIYRVDESNRDPYTVSKKFSAAGIKTFIDSEGYKLVKTLGAGATSYTDKKLEKDKAYDYMVVATYKEGSTTMVQCAWGYIAMEIQAPQNVIAELKGKKVTVTWEKDKYAAGYEVSYNIADKYGYTKTTEPVIKTTKKNKFTISGLEQGGSVTNLRVRAYTKKKEYSEYAGTSYSSTYVPLAAVKGITAQTVTVNGKEGVKISWKKVAGAKYYKVYRSTIEATYDADVKLYSTAGTEISRDGNDDYYTYSNQSQATSLYKGNISGSNNASYREYAGVYGSIVGTSAIDFSGDLYAGVTYYYTVQAFGDVPSGGADSEIYSVYCSQPAKIVAKTGFDVTTTSKGGKVTLTWESMKDSKVTYTVYRATSKKGKFVKIGTSKKPTFTDKKAKKGKTFFYKIQATGTNALKADVDATSAPIQVKAK